MEPQPRQLHRRLSAIYPRRAAARTGAWLPGTTLCSTLSHGWPTCATASSTTTPTITTSSPPTNRSAASIFDFGDALYTATVNELAIAAAYAILHKPDPLAAAAHLVRGYHAAHPLTPEEVSLLFSLIAMRLCVSVTMSAYQRTQEPDNEYLQISAAPAWQTLASLAQTSPLLAEATFRHACGWEPVAKSAQVTDWLRENSGRMANVIDTDWQKSPPTFFDLTPGSLLLGQLTNPDDTQAFTNLLFTTMAQNASTQTSSSSVPYFGSAQHKSVAKIGIGRYDEPRRIYTADSFRIPGNYLGRVAHHSHRTGFVCGGGHRGTRPPPRHYPQLRQNTDPLDYGPVIVLEHKVADHSTFYTLYGHLSESSLDGLIIGQPIAQGQKVAEIGTYPSNGGWPPHLHLQILVYIPCHPFTLSPLHPSRIFPASPPPANAPSGLAVPLTRTCCSAFHTTVSRRLPAAKRR